MWILILISVAINEAGNYEAMIEKSYKFDDIIGCFEGREQLLVDLELWDGYFPKGKQAVCIQVN